MTLTEIQALTDNELRVKAAELCGKCAHPSGRIKMELVEEDEYDWTCEVCGKDPRDNRIPDYPRDLNAIHEAEIWLKEGEGRLEYGNAYNTFTQIMSGYYPTSATARQRTEAFVFTLQS